MLLKKLLIGIFSLSLIGSPINSQAGIFSKTVKSAVTYKIGKSVVKNTIKKRAAKKIIKNGLKDSTKPFLKKELKVGEYGKLKQSPEKGLDYHHIPSSKQIEKYGVKKDNGIAIGVEKDRHSLTRTYKGRNREHLSGNEKPREALGRDIKDARQIYQDNNVYDKNVRKSLQEVIQKNKEKFPKLYEKK